MEDVFGRFLFKVDLEWEGIKGAFSLDPLDLKLVKLIKLFFALVLDLLTDFILFFTPAIESIFREFVRLWVLLF